MAAPITGLRRSEISFRRQGSSGLVWNDKFLTEESESDDHEKIKPRTEERELIKGERAPTYIFEKPDSTLLNGTLVR
ncbi:MAPK kinase substrate protein-like protein [Drosera capensis]